MGLLPATQRSRFNVERNMERIGSGCLLRSIRSCAAGLYQSEYRPTDARSEISIRPSRTLF
jgi:hypothetical protein